MEQEKLCVIKEKSYEAHIDEKVHAVPVIRSFLTGKTKNHQDMQNLIDIACRHCEIADQIYG